MLTNKQVLQNIVAFLERVPVTGKESIAWIEAYNAVQQELSKPTEVPDVHVDTDR